MKKTTVVVPWRDGIHIRTAARLVVLAQQFSSSITFNLEGRLADARSILSILALCATMGAVIDVEIVGEDERDATHAVAEIFFEKE